MGKENKEQVNEIYNLGIHQMIDIHSTGDMVLRVPGGWIYTTRWGDNVYSSTFVPYNEEFLVSSS